MEPEPLQRPEAQDRQLAHDLGAQLDAAARPEAALPTGEAWADDLATYKDQLQTLTPDAEASARMWQQIAASDPALQETPVRHDRAAARRPGLRLVPRPWIAVAACILVAVTIGQFLWPPQVPERLLAAADATIETVTLADGSTITLRPQARLYEDLRAERTRYRLEGEAFFDVAHNPDRTFQVQADDALVSVLGTRFFVSTWGEAPRVFLESGRVQVENLAGSEPLLLAPGEEAVVTDAGPAPVGQPAPEAALDWMEGSLLFDQQPADEVLREFAQHFGLTLDLPPSLTQETLSGRVLLETVEQGLDDLSVSLGGRFEQVRTAHYRYVPPSTP